MKKIVIRQNVVKWQVILFAVVCAIVAFCALPSFTTTGQAADAVEYIDRTWDKETNMVKEETKECTAYTLIDEKVGKDYDLTDDVKDGWYVLDRDVKRLTDAAISISGDVNLILEDNSKLYTGWADNDNYRIILEPNSTLTVYGQRKGTGEIIVDAPYGAAGIRVPSSATLNIKGGTIDAEGTIGGAGIGGNKKESAGTINILGGTVKAEGGNYGAGIGGGDEGAGGQITIYGGNVTAIGGSKAAGIGGGYKGTGGQIAIYDGTVKAKGGNYGAGIGGGDEGAGGQITIYGGNVTAIGGSKAAGIGGGYKTDGGNIAIYGGFITSTGGWEGAGIGGGFKGSGGTITINGGTIVAEGSNGAANIGGGKKGSTGAINVTGGNIKGYSNHTITLDGVNEEVEVVGVNCNYGINDVYTLHDVKKDEAGNEYLDEGKLYFNIISDEEYANLTEIIVVDKEGKEMTYYRQGDTDIFSTSNPNEILQTEEISIAPLQTLAEPTLYQLS